MNSTNSKTPNSRLRHERELRGWSQSKVANEIGTNTDRISRWESGNSTVSPYYREKLIELFGKNANELGFLDDATGDDPPAESPEESFLSQPTTSINLDGQQPIQLFLPRDAPQVVTIHIQQRSSISSSANSEGSVIINGRITNTSGREHPSEIEDTVNRREALQEIAGAGLSLAIAPHKLFESTASPIWERLSRTLAKSSHIDETMLFHLGQITKQYWQMRTTIGYRLLLSGFLGHLETVTQLLQISQPPTIHKRLCIIASEIAQYLGAILFDMKEYASARAYYHVSIEAAQEANDFTLWAVGLGRMSSLPIYSDLPQKALPHLRQAQELASQHCKATTRAWLASVEAEAQANLYDASACLRALKQAERFINPSETGDTPHEVRFDYARFLGYKGVCYLRLQQPNEALEALNEGAKLIDSTSVRQRSIILADSAAAYAQKEEVEAACEQAIRALTLTDQTKSELVMLRLQDFRRIVKKWETASYVKEFDEQMALRSGYTRPGEEKIQ
jgi:transcriptional regulator with XRE-family HTH domain/tetratricopeptide (TPR) repeat protein